MATSDKKSCANAWWDFVKTHGKSVTGTKTRKEKFEILSEMWKNKKASMVSVSSDYLVEMHASVSDLKARLQKAEEENKRLREMNELMLSELQKA